MWCLEVKHDSYGKVVLLFNPNDGFITKLNKSLPVKARNALVAKLVKKDDS
jgi:hypothetical protein